MSVRVVLVDDEQLVRTGLSMILGTEPDIEVVGTAGDGEQAIIAVQSLDPDVVLLDIRMPVLDGISTTRALVASGARARILVLTTFDTDRNIVDALHAGAAGFLLKDAPADQLVSAIRAAATGDAVLAPGVARRIADELARLRPPTGNARMESLTERERDVLARMAEGLSNAEIADRLFITEGTVKTHVARILQKLGVRDRLQAVVLAYRGR